MQAQAQQAEEAKPSVLQWAGSSLRTITKKLRKPVQQSVGHARLADVPSPPRKIVATPEDPAEASELIPTLENMLTAQSTGRGASFGPAVPVTSSSEQVCTADDASCSSCSSLSENVRLVAVFKQIKIDYCAISYLPYPVNIFIYDKLEDIQTLCRILFRLCRFVPPSAQFMQRQSSQGRARRASPAVFGRLRGWQPFLHRLQLPQFTALRLGRRHSCSRTLWQTWLWAMTRQRTKRSKDVP